MLPSKKIPAENTVASQSQDQINEPPYEQQEKAEKVQDLSQFKLQAALKIENLKQ